MRRRLACHEPRLICLTLFTMLSVACGSSSDENIDAPAHTPDAGEPSPPTGLPDAGAPDADAPDADAPPPSPLTIAGVVVSAVGQPIGDIGVRITGKPPVVTDASGHFSVSDVTPPYDLTVFGASDSPNAHVFVGLSTPSPRVIPAYKMLTNDGGKTKVSGTIGTVSAGHKAKVCVEGVSRPVYGCVDLNPGAGAYTIDPASWAGDPSVDGTVDVRVHAIRFAVSDEGVITNYTGYGTASGTLTAGIPATLDVTLAVVPATTTVTASMVPPAGTTPSGLLVAVNLTSGLSIALASASGATVDLTTPQPFLMPKFTGATFSVLGVADSGESAALGWQPGVAVDGTATAQLTALPAWVSPADDASDVTTQTSLEFDAAVGTQLTVICSPEGAGPGQPTFTVSTVKSSLTLPDLTDLGMPLPSAVKYNCNTSAAVSATAGADAMVTGMGAFGGFVGALQFGNGLRLEERGGFTFSKTSRTFTTK